jgi:hypothetical protein
VNFSVNLAPPQIREALLRLRTCHKTLPVPAGVELVGEPDLPHIND